MIELDWVQEFLASKGMKWKKEYYNHKTYKYEVATDWSDIRSSLTERTVLKLYGRMQNRREFEYYADFIINEGIFRKYREESEIQGSGSRFWLDKDYSDEWVMFLAGKIAGHSEEIEEEPSL